MSFLKKYFKGDPHIWAIIVGLSMFSLLAVYSSTGMLAYRFAGGNTAIYIIRHSGFMVIGLLTAFILHMFPYKYYARISQWMILIVIPLLLITLLYGVVANMASRWISLFGIITFQTSDLAKMALIMYLAQRLASKQNEILDFKKTLLPMYIVTCVVCVLIMPANFSTAALLFMVCVIMFFIGRASIKQLAGLCAITLLVGVVLIAGLYGLQKVGVNTVVTQRVVTWVGRIDSHFNSESQKDNYQVKQAKIAIGTGGVIGNGPGNSVQRNFLPHPYSDFIFAIIIEEWGIIGGIVVIFLYINLLFRSIAIVRKCDKTFPAFLVMGLSLIIVFQALINMAVAVGLLPVTGQTLPLISMGGTSILFTSAAFGIILSISREVRKDDLLRAELAPVQTDPTQPIVVDTDHEEENIDQYVINK